MRILINAANIHVGGGVQVSASFINDLYILYSNKDKIPFDIAISTEVFLNLNKNINTEKFNNFKIINIFGIKRITLEEKKYFDNVDILFSIFGPFYLKTNAKIKIVGFAQAWIAYPKNIAYSKLSLMNKIKYKLKFLIQGYYFKKNDHIVVELEHVKKALINNLLISSEKISIVYNAYSDIFNHPEDWNNIQYTKRKYTIGFLGRAYPHKNLSILASVSDILKKKYCFDCDFLFTLTPEEMESLKFNQYDNFFSVGPLNLTQCPSFYTSIDLLIFPSLLESFSITPIESMKMGCPLIASNIPFIHDICKKSAIYFDPLDPNDIAEKIFLYQQNKEQQQLNIQQGLKLVESMPNSMDRTRKYLELITNYMNHIRG